MQRILVIGAGFAGTWSALSAARLLDQEGVGPDAIEIVVVAPAATLDMRPRLYEENPAEMTAPLGKLFDATGVRFVAGTVDTIDVEGRSIGIVAADGSRSGLSYDRLVLAAGSRLHRPPIPGLADHGFSVDQRDEAVALETHLHGLASLPNSEARNTAVVVGGGFTGIELATELPARMRAILGDTVAIRVIVVEREAAIGPELGSAPRPSIEAALRSQGVEVQLGMSITEIDAESVMTTEGVRIPSLSVIWTGGMRASSLTEQIPAPRDALGRLKVDENLRVAAWPDIFATGDTACAATDDSGHHVLMSCQHALGLGRTSGNNAAADLLSHPLSPYRQERYVTCLDLGPWGAVVTEGWDREVQFAGPEAKAQKRFINTVVIAPPRPDRAEAFAAAEPAQAIAPEVHR